MKIGLRQLDRLAEQEHVSMEVHQSVKRKRKFMADRLRKMDVILGKPVSVKRQRSQWMVNSRTVKMGKDNA